MGKEDTLCFQVVKIVSENLNTFEGRDVVEIVTGVAPNGAEWEKRAEV
jgi:hypothetical protein